MTHLVSDPRGSSRSSSVKNVKRIRSSLWVKTILSSAACATGIFSGVANAVDLSWDGGGQTPVSGGAGIWDTALLRWWDGVNFLAWPNTTGDGAFFTGDPGPVYLPAALSLGSMSLSSNYRFFNNQIGMASNVATMTFGGSATIDTSARTEFIAPLAGTAGLNKNGVGIMIFHGSNAGLSGTVNVNAGTFAMGNTAVADISTATTINVAGGAAYDMGNWAGGFFTDTVGNISGAGNIYLGTAQNLGVTVGSALIAGGTNVATTFSGTISGGGRFSKTGTAVTTFSGVNTYTGATSVEGGTLRLEGGSALANNDAVFLSNVAGVTLQLGANETIGSIGGGGTVGGVVDIGAFTLTTGADNTFNGFAGNITGTGLVVKTGTGLWAVQNTTPVSAYGGKYRVDNGTFSMRDDVRFGAVPGAPVADYLTLAGGVFANSSGGGYTMNANRGITLTADSGIAVFGSAASNLVIAGLITGNSTITKTGIGILSIDGDNSTTFTGEWTAVDGVLATSRGIPRPFGTGGMSLTGSTLSVAPGAAASIISTEVAPGAGRIVEYGPGVVFNLNKNVGNTELTVTIGDSASATSTLIRRGRGTLVVQAAQGIANLGTAGNELLKVNGGVSTVNGIVPSVFGTTSATVSPGDFLGYGGNGFVKATYTSTDITTSLATDVVEQTANAALAGPANAYALKIGDGVAGTTVTATGQTINLGGGSAPGMLIVNTLSGITGGTVDFGTREGIIYTQGAAGNVSAVITGSDGLSKVGGGPLVLGATATYSGDTNINQGTVQLSGSDQLPTGTNVTLYNTGALNLNGNSQTVASLNSDNMTSNINMGVNGRLTVGAGNMRYLGTITNGVSTSSTLIKNGAGRLTLGFELGTVSIESPTLAYNKLVVQNGGAVNVSRTVSLPAASPTAGVALPDTFTLDGGTLRISSINSAAFGSGGASTYTLSGSDTTLRGATIGAGGGTIEVSEAKEIVLWQRNNLEVTGASLVNGSGTLFKTGPGFLRLGVGNNSFTGKMVILGGNLQFQTDQAVGAGIGNCLGPAPVALVPDQLTLDGGMIQSNGSGVIAATRGITIGANGGSINNAGFWTFNNPFFGSGAMNIIQGNALAGRTARFVASSNSYSGTVNVLNGMVDVVGDTALGTGQVNLTPQFPVALSKISGASDTTLANNIALNPGSTIDVRVDGGIGNLILSGNISGPNTLTKSRIGAATTNAAGGVGTLILSGNNTFTGDLIVQTGTLVARSATALGSSSGVTMVVPGATLGIDSIGGGPEGVPAEPTYIAGTGVGGVGAMVNFAGDNNYNGNVTAVADATIAVPAGSLKVGNVNGASVVTKTGTGRLTANHFRTNGLNIQTREVQVAQGPANNSQGGISKVGSFLIAGGPAAPQARLDLTNNAMIISDTPAGPEAEAAVRSYISAGYAGGSWGGDGVASSSADFGVGSFGLGYSDAGPLGITTFLGVPVLPTDTLIRFTLYGDADINGTVNLSDFNRLASNFGSTNALWREGDFDYNSNVNLGDFNRLAANFGLSASPGGPTPADWSALASAVPEPTSLGVVGLGAIGLLARRRRS